MTNFISQLRPASYRGISFLTDGDEKGFGQRIEAHQYPGRDEPYHEEMGADLEEFTISAVIIGDGFVTRAAAFEAALKKSGPAQLLHPHYGTVQVICLRARRMHSSNAVGEVQFSITLQKYGGPQFPTAASNTAAGLLSGSDLSFDSLLADFTNSFQVSGIPDFITSDAVSRSASFVSNLSSLMASAGFGSQFAGILPVLDTLSSGFASNVVSLFKGLRDLTAPAKKPAIGKIATAQALDSIGLIRGLISSSDYSLADSVVPTTANKAIRVSNAESLDLLYRMSSLAAAVGAVRHASFTSQEEAVQIRSQIGERISSMRDILGEAKWDSSWQAAASLQANLNRDVDSQIGRLPKTLRIRPEAPRSSISLAHRLYGDNLPGMFQKAGDIVSRNKVRHPGYISPQTLEVLIDAS